MTGMMKVLLLAVVCTCVLRANAQYNYGEVLGHSLWFYEAERSGDIDEGSNRVGWRGDSALGDFSSDGQWDLVGGWYDAGDHVKFGLPHSFAATVVTWGVIDFRSGYEAAGEYQNGLNCIRWALDYFVKCHYGASDLNCQCGDGYADHAYWGRPEQMTMARPCEGVHGANGMYASDVAGETAAALAAGSIAFSESDPSYSATLLQHAKDLYEFAYNSRGVYTDWINASDFYGSSGFTDELCHGAAWLYRATGEQTYMDRALENYDAGVGWAYSWDAKGPACQMLMYIITNDQQYAGHVEAFIRSWMPGGGIHYTPGGLAWRDTWGSLRYAANTAFLALMADQYGIMAGEARGWAQGQVDYMLGTNPNGRSYVVGYGSNPPQQCHHRAASCDPDWSVPCNDNNLNMDSPNPSILYGALVGGPDENDYYFDDRNDYIFNEVATDYNGGFTGAVAALSG